MGAHVIHRRKPVIAAAVLSLAALTALPAGAADAPGHRTPSSRSAAVPAVAAAFPDPPTGASALTDLGAVDGWQVQSSATAQQTGAQISTPGFPTTGWLPVQNDGGGAPGTEINALLSNGGCPDVFFSAPMKSCFGQMTKVGPDTLARFSVPWWYRTEFAAPPAGQSARLVLGG